MRVIATGDQGSDLPEVVVARVPARRQSRFNVSVGTEYVVYAMALWMGGIIVMVLDDGQRPHWFPVELFRVSEASVPSSWLFGYVKDPELLDPQSFWGYESLVRDPGHHAALVDLQKAALRVFLDECDRSDLPDTESQKLEALRAAAN